MKKLLILMITIFGLSAADAASLCRKNCIQSEWKNNNTMSGSISNNEGYHDVAWSAMITSFPAGTINGIAKCADSNSNPSPTQYYCWCKVNDIDGCASGTPWVFLYYYDDEHCCQDYCARDCARCVRDGTFESCSRSALLQELP